MKSERKIIQDMVVIKKKDHEILSPRKEQYYEPVVTSKHKRPNSLLWVINIVLIIIVVITIGSLFTSLTITIESKQVQIPLDINMTIYTNTGSGDLLFGTISETQTSESLIASNELLDETQEAMRQSFNRELEEIKNRLMKTIPESKIVFPLIIAEPILFTSEQQSDTSIRIMAQRSVVILVVDSEDFAKTIQENTGITIAERVIVSDPHDLLATTTALVSSNEIPEIIPVRLTGSPVVTAFLRESEIKQELSGLRLSEIKKKLDQREEIESFSLHSKPFWRRIAPSDQNLIQVTIN